MLTQGLSGRCELVTANLTKDVQEGNQQIEDGTTAVPVGIGWPKLTAIRIGFHGKTINCGSNLICFSPGNIAIPM